MTLPLGMKTHTGSAMVMRIPRTIDIEITAQCNLRCSYCYFFHNPEVDYRELPTGEWLTFFDELGSLGIMNVILAGGEPFSRHDLPFLIEGIVRNRMRFSILSNGTLIDDKISAFIASSGRCDYVQVSVDGSCAEVHDSCRGKGSFDGAVRAIRTLQRHGLNVAVRCTIHRHNVHDLQNIAYLLLEELNLPGFSTNSAGYLGTCRLNSADVLLNIQERQTAMSTLLRLAETYKGRISANAGPLAEARMWQHMEEARAQGAPAFPNGGHLTACGCPHNKLTVRADGAYVLCAMLAHSQLGRINRDSLADIWQRSTALNQLRLRRTTPLSDFAFCAGCAYTPYCTGNCPGLAYTLTGKVDHPSPDACLRRFLREGGTIA
ncbi:MAG TPA: SynChlorMet cassette radical SAM/SPASM protein ScmE [Thermodesulfovibrionales bacterium]|nr:SynChlorMet cassette radical SAM/SPASM protein ScmE [Thermodesulfovibrionales bacterium]